MLDIVSSTLFSVLAINNRKNFKFSVKGTNTNSCTFYALLKTQFWPGYTVCYDQWETIETLLSCKPKQ